MNSIINRSIGNYIKKNRLKKRLTGHEMGQLLNISQQQVSRYENGISKISFELILLFIQKLDLTLEDFFEYIKKELENNNTLNKRKLKKKQL